jgi:predicted N-acetyltransferase YhbS
MTLSSLPQALGDGLVLRQATPADVETLVAFHQNIQQEGEWTRVLVDGQHPTTSATDFTIVEECASGKIVSSMGIISQTWSYAGIPFGVARMEMVSTEAEYRWRGLVRAQFAVLERESAARGHALQVVVGRPFVYKRLGYHMALRYSAGRTISRNGIPTLPAGQAEAYSVRLGTPADLPLLVEWMQATNRRYLVAAERDEAQWRHDFFERNVADRLQLRVIEAGGQPVGAIIHTCSLDDGLLDVYGCELAPGQSFYHLLPSFLRYLERTGDEYAAKDSTRLDGFSLWLGTTHPLFGLLGGFMQREPPESPFAWYTKVSDLPGFLRLIAPVLEQRLANSVLAGYSGRLELSFYARDAGLSMQFEQGRLVQVEPAAVSWWQRAIPLEYFLQLMFGYRSLEEIENASAEVHLVDQPGVPLRTALGILFPRQHSRIFSLA